MRVKENYYDNLKRITDKFGDGELIPIRKAAKFLGCDVRCLFKELDFPVKKIGRCYYVTAVALARWLS